MPLLHCKKCHHEFEGTENSKCDWCGKESYVLLKKTALEKAINWLMKRQKCC